MAMRTSPGGKSLVNGHEAASFDGADQRVFPRVKVVKEIELAMGEVTLRGQTYDIGQGGLCFVVPHTVALGPATVRIARSNYVFQGKILASHKSGVSEALHFHFQFDQPVELATLAVILGL